MDVDRESRAPAGVITVEDESADRRVLCLRGDVDTAVATRFTTAQGRRRIVVDAIDAAGVTFISSSGLALMLHCAEASAAAGHRLVLRASSRPIDRALQLAGIDTFFPRPVAEEAPPSSS